MAPNKLMFIGKLFRQSHHVSLFVHLNCSHFSPLNHWLYLMCSDANWVIPPVSDRICNTQSLCSIISPMLDDVLMLLSQALPYTSMRTGLMSFITTDVHDLVLNATFLACVLRGVRCVTRNFFSFVSQFSVRSVPKRLLNPFRVSSLFKQRLRWSPSCYCMLLMHLSQFKFTKIKRIGCNLIKLSFQIIRRH
jgi:hypothetical protein